MPVRKKKRKATTKQLKALAKARAARKRNLKKNPARKKSVRRKISVKGKHSVRKTPTRKKNRKTATKRNFKSFAIRAQVPVKTGHKYYYYYEPEQAFMNERRYASKYRSQLACEKIMKRILYKLPRQIESIHCVEL